MEGVRSSPNSKPETRNPKPETRNPKPETRNPKPEILKPETLNVVVILVLYRHLVST